MDEAQNEHILIVDDSHIYAFFLNNALEKDYTCDIAHDGISALHKATGNQPDLILLDIMMPLMNGHDVCTSLKANTHTKHIPIIFMTSKDSPEEEALGLKLGAVDYITKPFHMPIIRARIENHLKTQRLLRHLRSSLREIETLQALLPMCAFCKKIRDDQGYWNNVEEYISRISRITFSHGICPDCRHRFYGNNGDNG